VNSRIHQDNRMGAVLVSRGVMTQDQVDQVMAEQNRHHRPFGQIANDLFGIDERDLWRAWAVQITDFCPFVDLACEPRIADALKVMDSRTAWHYRILPLRFEEDELVCATSPERLPDALAYLNTETDLIVRFVLTEAVQLEHFIMRDYAPDAPRTAPGYALGAYHH
jgi:hypothetical protein